MSTGNIFRMFCYNEQRNEAVAKKEMGQKRIFSPHRKKNTCFYIMDNDPVEGKTGRYRRKGGGRQGLVVTVTGNH